jgi:phosphoribosylformimino-5-aminoimidazole carboxamide ribotide isomerase
MLIIPVIDLLDGRAVHARGGRRHLYRSLSTPLCRDPDPQAVAAAYLSLHPFAVLYLADLNAIQDKGDNTSTIGALRRRFRKCEFWVDAGTASMDLAGVRLRPVIGTETGLGVAELARLRAGRHRPILSLDFGAEGYRGDPAILGNPDCWPADVIVMSLSKVGSRGGPDLDRIASLKARAPRKRFHAGGGLRDERDLELLAAAGAAGVLTATALHEGAIDSAALARLGTGEKKPRPKPGRVVG